MAASFQSYFDMSLRTAGRFQSYYDYSLPITGSFHDPHDWVPRMAGAFIIFCRGGTETKEDNFNVILRHEASVS
jgi:hypothetical protein